MIDENSLNQSDITVSTDPNSMYQKMLYTQRMPSAVWMDATATIYGSNEEDGTIIRRSLEGHLDAAVAQQAQWAIDEGSVSPMAAVIIVYNLPDRDCAALASNGLLVQVGDPSKIDQANTDANDQAMQDKYGVRFAGKYDALYAAKAELADGMRSYKEDYIDVIADVFAMDKYKDLRIIAMLEPDSYPNMITNVNRDGFEDDHAVENLYCTKVNNFNNGEGVYVQGMRHAIKTFHDLPNDNVYTYLDIGHSGWLGWDDYDIDESDYSGTVSALSADNDSNMQRGVLGFANLVDGADGSVDGSGFNMIRGFASNTSGYTPLVEPFLNAGFDDRFALSSYFEWNPAIDEMSFVVELALHFAEAGFDINNELGFILDTARNGWGGDTRPASGSSLEKLPYSEEDADIAHNAQYTDESRIDTRTQRGRWCNVYNAGIGASPMAEPPGFDYVDAFFWMKPPGESDGGSNPADANGNADGKSYDPVCGGEGSPKTNETAGRVIGNKAGLDTRADQDDFFAPHAGSWFHEQYKMLIENACPPLGELAQVDGGNCY